MTETLLDEFEAHIDRWTLVPDKGGVFEVELDGELVYSKEQTGRHATIEEVQAAFAERFSADD